MVTKSAKRITGFLGTSALTRPLFMLGAASALLGAGPAQALDANTLPQNPNVVGGKDSFHQSGNTLNVNQSTNRTVIDWRSFDIGSSAQVNFNQPGTSSIAVNRVNASANASQIEGGLHANGQVWILNPNGVFFGKTARVDAAGIVATTANIDANAFMAGSNKLQMTGADHGSVENQGKITVGANGLAAFVAPSVRNSGTINATVGRVALAAGTTYTLDLAGDHLVELGLGSVKAVVDSSGKIVNPGGTIALSAKAAGQVVNSVVNVSGVVTASSVTKSGGTITLGADNVATTSTAQLSADAGTNGNGGAITSVANVQGNYAGSFSAQGGSASGNGGSVETSGKSVHVDDGIKVNTLASNGLTGSWTVDPENLTIGTTDSGTDTDTDQSISAATVESQLGTTSVNLKANLSITVNAAIDTSGQSNSNTLNFKDEDVDGLLTVNLNAPITLASTQHLTGDANIVNVAGALGGLIQNGVDVARSGGATVNVLAGTYNDPRVNISKDGIDLVGAPGATLVVPDISVANGLDAIDVWANDVTIEGLTILGPANSASGVGTSYQSFAWGNNVTRGIAIHNGAQNFSIHDNDIEGLRNDVLIDGRNTGTVYDNTLDNSKSGISVQYTDAGLLSGSQFTDAGLSQEQSNTVSIHDNQQGVFGNEWGANFHLNGHYDSSNGYHANGDKIATNATSTVQSALLAFQNANDGMTAQDQGYSQSNRTDVTVSMSGSDANQGSVLSTLKTIQGGVNAVVAGGTVNVLDGTYVVSAANGYTNGYLGISKSLNLVGQDEGGVIIDARNASSYGIRIIGGTDGVTLSNFTLWGVTAVGGYGVKAEDTTNLKINNVTSQGAYKAQFDLNGVRTGEVNNVVANGNGVAGGTGSTKGAAIAITDSQNVTVENSHIIGGSYGGIGIYQSNKADGYTYQAENITIADTNTYDANGVANYNYVYTEDESATNNFGTLNIEGFNTVAGLDANPSDTFKYFQNSKADAENYLDSLGAASLGYVEGWTGTAGTNNFSVDTVNGHAMSIQAAVNGAAAGATINVGAGTYTGDVTIAKSGIQLLSENGSGATTIQGVAGTSAEGTIFLTPGSDNTQIGDIGHGFKIVGFDSANPGTEVAAVYIQGANSGSKIIGNEITAAGDEAILTEYGAAVSGLTIDHNLIDGQTFVGPNPAGQGSSQQFTLWNVPRQAVVISTGSSNTTFTNNTITAVTGGLNTSGQEQGNSLATIDSTGATITGNTFAGTTDYGSDALRARGTNTVISGNTFDGTNMAADTNMLEVYDTALSGTFDDLLANNTFTNGAVWFDHAVTGAHNEYYVFRGINSAVSKATPGDTVYVQSGTYTDTTTINKGITLEGADANNRPELTGGILLSGAFSNLTLKDLSVSGDGGGNKVISGGAVTNLTVDDVKIDGGSVAGRFGMAGGKTYGDISITNSQFVNINGWAAFDNSTGGSPTALTSVNFSNNLLDNVQGHIAFRQLNPTDVTISGNVVENTGNATNSFGGIFKVFNGGTVDFSGNTVSGIGTSGFNPANEAPYGAVLLTRDVATLNVTGNIFTDNNMAFAVEPGKSLPGTVNFSNNTFDNNKYAIYLPTNVSGSGTINFGAGNNFIDGANTVKDIVWTSSSALDLTNVAFNGKLGSAMTDNELYGVEYLITDGLDNTAYGLARIKAGNVYVSGSIANGVAKASAGDTVNVQDGSYMLAGELDITKSLTLKGQSQNGTIIASNSTGYGINVTADDVSLQNFTFHGPTATGSTYGIKVTPDTGAASDRLLGFDIENVTIDQGYRTGLDLNGVDGATIKNVSVSNIAHGNGMALTDSANVTITGSTTSNNAWGGLALYQTNTYYDQQVNNIVVDGTNSFNDTIPVYTEDQSASQNFGSISLAGFSYVVQSPNNANDVYSWFQKTEQAAFDFATNAALSNNNVNVPTATVQGYSGSGAYGNNVFYVGTGSNAVAMSIGNAITQAASGGTVNVNTGTYAEDVTDATQLTFNFGDVTVNSFTLASGAAGSALNGDLTATGAIALNGAATVTGDLTAASFTSNATLALTGDLDASGAAALNGASSITGNLAADSLVTGNTLALTGNIAATNGVTLGGASTITGNVNAKTFTANGTLALNGNLAATGAALFNGASTVNGNVNAASITATDAFALNGNAAASGAIALNGATTLAGNLTGGSIALGATTLTGNTSLDTSAANGAIKVASVNGSTAGGQSLAIKAGTGSVSLGNAGATTRLGAVSDASKTTLTGSTYNANSFLFGGDVTLTSADTTLNTTQSAGAAGDITFQGDLFGTTDGSQSLTLIAGPGTGAASANGDILLQNAGTTAVNLNNLTVSGDDFTALTVDLAGNYNSLLTGNQVFAADTLNVKGNANSIVGGDASGHIVASGDVTIAAGGDVSGTISGENVNLTGDDVNSVVTANNAANIKGNTVEGSYTADTVTLIASNNVDAAVDATDFVLAANHGSVDGTWTTINTDGSNVVSVNGQTTVGMANVNPNQLVVEGFVLPAGTTIGANGQLILPEGTLLGLLSPGGGKPKMILVHTVHQLGELLASGYSVIVIDLSGHGKEKLVQLAAN